MTHINPDWTAHKIRGRVHEVCTSARGETVLIGKPDHDDEDHNCDAMGCGQSHVLWRGKITHQRAPLDVDYTLTDLREHLVSCFAPDFCIVGNTTQRHIVRAIDAAHAEIERLRRDRDSYTSSDFERQLAEARSQLVAMTAARDEACELAEAATFIIDNGLCERCSSSVCNIEVESIDRIRRVGRDLVKSSLDVPT